MTTAIVQFSWMGSGHSRISPVGLLSHGVQSRERHDHRLVHGF